MKPAFLVCRLLNDELRAPVSLQVGQELWFVYRERRRGAPCIVIITKVGRKWAQLNYGGYRVNVDTLKVDGAGYTSPAQCWLTREAWEDEVNRQDAWSKLRGYFDHRWQAPDGLPTEKIEEILAALPPRS